MQDGDIVVLSKIKSYGYDGNVKLECLSDGKLIDVKELDIEDGESLIYTGEMYQIRQGQFR